MAKHAIKKDRTVTVDASEAESQWVVAEGVVLSGDPGIRSQDVDGVSFDIRGRIASQTVGLLAYTVANNDSSDDISVSLTKTGRIAAVEHGISVTGSAATVENAGRITSEEAPGVHVKGDGAHIENSGRIAAGTGPGILLVDSTFFQVENSGVIASHGAESAISGNGVSHGSIVNTKQGTIGTISFSADSDAITVNNKGKIAEGVGANNAGVTFGDGDDHLVNRGLIGGDISFGDGNDYGDFRKGDLGGAYVLGGDGDDIFVISDNSTKIFEFGNGGSDTIKTTVNYTLGNLAWDDIETLQAIGKKNVSLGGNDDGNVLKGNAGNNAMSGGAGNDILAGLGGKDTLSGDMGADHFYFYEKGGIDTITDFALDEDVIHIVSIPGIDDFDDLMGLMSSVDFDSDKDVDTVIDLGGGNKIRLTDVVKSDLEMSDFSIFPA